MKPRSLNLILLAAVVVVAALTWVAESDPAELNTEFLPEMVRSVPFNSFSGNPDLADGKTLRHPVKGTIPRGFTPIHYDATPEDSLRAADELANPHQADDGAAVKRGESVYGSFCRHCHGAGGNGDGAVVLRGYPGPPSFFAEEPLARKDGQMFHIISYGQGKMPAHASQISREDRWKVITYIRTLQSKSR